MQYHKLAVALLLSANVIISGSAAAEKDDPNPLIIQEQGSFTVGGTVISTPGVYDPIKMSSDGQTLHGDHAYIFYQIPVKARKFPLVFLHGAGQFSKTWETTPDGREGFKIFSCVVALEFT